MKIFDPNLAAQAYSSSANIAKAKPAQFDKKGADGVKFSDFLKKTAESSINTMRKGEVVAAQGIQGKADPTDVVAAVNAADITLQSVVAIRDRMVTAYNEILRMPI